MRHKIPVYPLSDYSGGMKKNNRKLSVPANAKKVAERAMSGVVERKKRHRRHGKRRSG
jgi:hypothetical protein